jgi:hypothetical protein
MIRKIVKSLVVMLLVVFVGSFIDARERQTVNRQLKINGRIVGYDQSVSLTGLTSTPKIDVLIVRVEKIIKGQEKANYIKVLREYWKDDFSLSKDLTNDRKEWTFLLTKAQGCDESLREMQFPSKKTSEGTEIQVPRYKPSTGAEAEGIPEDLKLPCYRVRPDGITPLKKQ